MRQSFFVLGIGYMLNLLKNSSIFIVGIKGTGLSNLAVKLTQFSIKVSGSDIPEYFSTQKF